LEPSSTYTQVATDTSVPVDVATTQNPNVSLGTCQLVAVEQPPWPVKTLLPNELDQETGLHMTGISQRIDLATYRLKVTGLVDHTLSLTYDDVRCMPNVTDNPELNCPGVFVDRANWTGVPIKHILELAGVEQGATMLILVSADGYEVRLPIEAASADKNFLAYEVNGKPLPVQHGFPLRAVFPSMWGSYWLKWLVEIRIS
jgi:DMSO/TMAO reductase YedYZ molybdopterin-dependent catalytic subunit